MRITFLAVLILASTTGVVSWAQDVSPVIRYANILGGSGSDQPVAVATDAAGNLYITGRTDSVDFPGARWLSSGARALGGDIFVAKLDPSGGKVLYSVALSGATAAAIAVDASGSAYVAGSAVADTFPVTPGALSTTGNCFLFKLDPTGSALTYSTRLPCAASVNISPAGLTVDSAGSAYLTGRADTVTTTPGAYKTTGHGPFAMKVNATGSTLLYSTHLIDSDAFALPHAIALDANGNAYITGEAHAKGYTATVRPLPSEASSDSTTSDVFLLALSADGSKLLFSTIFGGYGADAGFAVAVDAEKFIYVAGTSRQTTGQGPEVPFPTTAGALARQPGFPSGFLTKLAPLATAAVFSTLLPDTESAACLAVSPAGIDVLGSGRVAGEFPDLYVNRLLRLNGAGTALLNSSLVSTINGARCGGHGGNFGLAAPAGRPMPSPALTSPDLNTIGSGGGDYDVWYSTALADSPGAPRLELDRAELLLRTETAPDGKPILPAVSIHAETDGRSVPLTVVPRSSSVSVNPSRTVTPADVAVTANAGGYRDRLVFFAPGAKNGLVIVPVGMTWPIPALSIYPPQWQSVSLFAAGPNAPPVSVTVPLSASAQSDIYGNSRSVPLNFTVRLDSRAPSWLKVDPVSGITPAVLRITADPTGLQASSLYPAKVHIEGPQLPGGWPEIRNLDLTVRLRIGPVAPPPPALILTPAEVSFRLTKDQPSSSATLKVASSGDPVSFTIGSLPEWLTVTPSSGTTPVDLRVTAAMNPVVSGISYDWIQFRQADGMFAGSIPAVVYSVLPDYVGYLTATPFSMYGTSDPRVPRFAPGALFLISLDLLQLVPPDAIEANPAALAPSLGGFSFTLNGVRVPLRRYRDRSFLAQIPPELEPGTYELIEYDSSGTRIARTEITVAPLAPKCLDGESYSPRAVKPDGSIINATNPVRSFDQIIVRMTGQGAVQPAIASGLAAAPGTPSVPAEAVNATIGGKPARVLSASMSSSEAGVLEVKLEVPELAAGSYSGVVRIGMQEAAPVPLRVVQGPLVPRVHAGGVVDAATYLPRLAPGSLFSIFGSDLATGVQHAADIPLPGSLGGVSVVIGGRPAPLLYVSPSQINAQVPVELMPDPNTPVTVSLNGVAGTAATVAIVPAAPGIFQFGANRAAVQNQDYSVNTAENGAAPGSIATAYLTGAGGLDNPVATGEVASSDPLSRTLDKVTATVNGVPAEVSFSGLAPGFVGLMQVNFQVPNLPPGSYPLLVTMNGMTSNSAFVTVK